MTVSSAAWPDTFQRIRGRHAGKQSICEPAACRLKGGLRATRVQRLDSLLLLRRQHSLSESTRLRLDLVLVGHWRLLLHLQKVVDLFVQGKAKLFHHGLARFEEWIGLLVIWLAVKETLGANAAVFICARLNYNSVDRARLRLKLLVRFPEEIALRQGRCTLELRLVAASELAVSSNAGHVGLRFAPEYAFVLQLLGPVGS